MKSLSYFFAIIAILFLSIGLAYLMHQMPTAMTEKVFFSCFFGGMIAIVGFLVTEHLSNPKNY
jgi:hypothetical protein